MQEYKIFEAYDKKLWIRESLNRNFVPVETYPELKCTLERKNRKNWLRFDNG
jgi:hypothetical protein